MRRDVLQFLDGQIRIAKKRSNALVEISQYDLEAIKADIKDDKYIKFLIGIIESEQEKYDKIVAKEGITHPSAQYLLGRLNVYKQVVRDLTLLRTGDGEITWYGVKDITEENDK